MVIDAFIDPGKGKPSTVQSSREGRNSAQDPKTPEQGEIQKGDVARA